MPGVRDGLHVALPRARQEVQANAELEGRGHLALAVGTLLCSQVTVAGEELNHSQEGVLRDSEVELVRPVISVHDVLVDRASSPSFQSSLYAAPYLE